MKIYSADCSASLVETYVIEPFKTGARDGFDPVVGHQEVFLPPHEHVFAIETSAQRECRILFSCLRQRSPGWKSRPMLQVDLFGATPRRMGCAEEVFGPNDLAFEESGQCGMIIGQSW